MMPRLIASALLLAVSFAALAGQVGQLRATSTLDQPLDARVEMYGFSAAEAADARILLQADIAASPAERAALGLVTATAASYADGSPYIRLTSSQPITEPVVRFRLRLATAGQTRIAHYVLALDPAPVAVTSRRARPRADATPAPAVPAGPARQYGPVRPGQTLWRILSELGLTGSGQQALIGRIVAASPNAFINGDADRLKAGAMLNIPARPALVPVAALEAAPTTTPTPVASGEAPAGNPAVTQTPATAPPVVEQARRDQSAGVQATPTNAATAAVTRTDSSTPTALPADIAARQARLDALAEKFAAIRTRYEQQRSPTPATAAVTSPTPAAAAPEPSPVPRAAPATPAAINKPRAASLAPGDTSFSATILLWAGAVVSLLALLGGATFAWRRWRQRRYQQISDADDERALAEIARKTEDRLRLEEELRQRRAGQAPETKASDSSIERSVMAQEENTLTEIEHRIAHGQYSEAQSMLETVIAQTPHNYRAKLRLAEIHYLSERAEAFVALASDLYENHRAEIGDDGWARVVRMGKVLAPDRPPFSGPVEVAGEN